MKAIVSVLFLCLIGCASSEHARRDGLAGYGDVRTYKHNPDKVWNASKDVLKWAHSDAIEERKDENLMIASIPMNFCSYGTACAVWIKGVTDGQTEVRIVTRRKYIFSLITRLTEGGFHEELSIRLGGGAPSE